MVTATNPKYIFVLIVLIFIGYISNLCVIVLNSIYKISVQFLEEKDLIVQGLGVYFWSHFNIVNLKSYKQF